MSRSHMLAVPATAGDSAAPCARAPSPDSRATLLERYALKHVCRYPASMNFVLDIFITFQVRITIEIPYILRSTRLYSEDWVGHV